jgi:hypothetical protein
MIGRPQAFLFGVFDQADMRGQVLMILLFVHFASAHHPAIPVVGNVVVVGVKNPIGAGHSSGYAFVERDDAGIGMVVEPGQP